MAKRAKHEAAEEGAGPGTLDAAEFQRVIAEANRQQGLASEYNGSAGKVVRDAIDRLGLVRAAFNYTRKLSKMDEAKRQGEIRAFLEYIEAAGFLDQSDAFSDIGEQLQGMADRIRVRQPERQPSAIMERIVN